jgi:WD40 repeat protein
VLRDARTSRPLGKPSKRRTARITSVALGSVAGQPVIIAGARDKTIRRWDAATGEPIGEPFAGHADSVTSVVLVTVDDERTIVASGGLDGTVRLWDAKTGAAMLIVNVGMPVEALALHPGVGVVVATVRGVLFLDIDVLGIPPPPVACASRSQEESKRQ